MDSRLKLPYINAVKNELAACLQSTQVNGNPMAPLTLTMLTLVVLDTLLQLAARQCNRARLAGPLPAAFAGVYTSAEYNKSTAYLGEGMALAQWEEIFDLILLAGFWLSGGFAWLDSGVRTMTLNPVLCGLLFFGVLSLAKTILGLPFTLYATFSIDARYGFNRTTPATFILDLFKGLVLTAVIGGVLGAVLLWALSRFGSGYWWLCWLILIVLTTLLQYLAPKVIMPLFNQFEPLEEGELKHSIEAYARSIQFPLKQILVMDGSRRSTKSNAFFTGFGKHRRIVLFDTLIDKHPPRELLAVLAHEMGHYKLRHTLKNMLLSYAYMGLILLGLALALDWPSLPAALGLAPSIHSSLLAVMILFTPLNRLLSTILNGYSRRNEYAADRFAAHTTRSPQDMIAALLRLARDNFSHLTPHPLWIWLTYSHPPLLERIQALEKTTQGFNPTANPHPSDSPAKAPPGHQVNPNK